MNTGRLYDSISSTLNKFIVTFGHVYLISQIAMGFFFSFPPAAPQAATKLFDNYFREHVGKGDNKDEHSLRIVPLAVKFAVPQKAGVPERVPARRAPHTLLVPEAVGDSEQESVCDQAAASGAHWPLIHVCGDGETLEHSASTLEHLFQTTSSVWCTRVFD